ncbi:MAG: alpha/beta hydrolase, partial [Alphaproteobacteria bacterium]|nr:alpha/beta hydrolase [Alphaproteobacteria bacterium]
SLRCHGTQSFGDVPVPVFVHGAGMDQSIWAPLTDELAVADRPFLALDLPGHGGSAGAPCGTIEAAADWLAEAIAAAGISRAVAVGHSMGALAALDLAARHPDRVSGIVLLGVAARMPVHPDLLGMAQRDDPAASGLIGKWGVDRSAPASVVSRVADCIAAAPDGSLAVDLAACDGYQGAAAAAARVACPALLILGASDRMTPPDGAAPLLAVLGRAQKQELAQAGHMIMLEAPDRTRAALLAFLDEVR